jgi:glycine cleavage system H protein
VADRRYSESHEWVQLEGKLATVGITDFAQAQLGDVVFLELPRVGQRLAAGDSFGVIESVKAASDLYSPVEGTITEVNEKLAQNPELVNSDPLGEGWLIKLETSGELPGSLLDEAAYQKLTEGAAH